MYTFGQKEKTIYNFEQNVGNPRPTAHGGEVRGQRSEVCGQSVGDLTNTAFYLYTKSSNRVRVINDQPARTLVSSTPEARGNAEQSKNVFPGALIK